MTPGRLAAGILGAALVAAGAAAPTADEGSTDPAPAPIAPVGAARGLIAFQVLDGDRVLAERAADLRIQPASVLKALVAACALERLGPDSRIETRVTGWRPDGRGRLAGDLILHGAGDPTWNDRYFASGPRPLEQLAAAVAARGVLVVEGELVFDLGRFPPPREPRSRPLAELALGWAASPSALAIDENVVRLRMTPGAAVGAPIEARWIDPTGAPELLVRATTVGADRHGRGTVAFLPLWDRGALLLAGEYPVSEPPYEVAVAAPDPARAVAARFRAALARHGVAVRGGDRIAERDVTPGIALAHWRSPPLEQWLAPILEDSHNWYAEMLLRQLAVAAAGSGRLEHGLASVASCLVEEAGVAPSDFELDDGSGLSADNLVTARAVARTLAWAWRRPWRDTLIAALATPGEGTLAGWPPLPPVAAKTGGKRHTQALAGYLRPASDRPIAFAVILDHRIDGSADRRAEIARLLWDFSQLGQRE